MSTQAILDFEQEAPSNVPAQIARARTKEAKTAFAAAASTRAILAGSTLAVCTCRYHSRSSGSWSATGWK